MDRKKRIVFLTGTRADFGKIKSLIQATNDPPDRFEVHIFATGMHMDPKYGFTVEEIQKCGFPNIYRFINQSNDGIMDRSFAHTVLGFGDYVRLIKPDLIIVHGDRVEALAGAMVGALNNVLVAHVEGGEVSGTVDELIRHSVTKMSHLHFVSHEEAGRRLVQLGEEESSIHVIGSPDMDIMKSPHLPSIESVRAHYEVDFAEYGILLFHPVTTEIDSLQHEITEVLDAVEVSGRSFVAIFPNNDRGSDIILDAYAARIAEHPRVRLFPSISFESMLVMLQNARFVLGNSSMGIREAPFYGIPTINVGTRQTGRSDNQDIINVQADGPAILWAIQECDRIRSQLRSSQEFGSGNSHERFRRVLESAEVWETSVQKLFCDIPLIHLDRSAA